MSLVEVFEDPKEPRVPEYRLVAAVMARALKDYAEEVYMGFSTEVRDWMSDDDASEPWSYGWVCDVLGVDAGRLRRALESGNRSFLTGNSLYRGD